MRATERERVEHLDGWLWSYRDDSFLPHGRDDEPMAERQPVLITPGMDNPNGADALFLIDGAEPGEIGGFTRCVLLFDGRDEAALAAARRKWSGFKAAGAAGIVLAARGGGGMAQGSLRWAAVPALGLVVACTEPATAAARAAAAGSCASPAAGRRRHRRRWDRGTPAGPTHLQYLVGQPHTDIPVPVNPNLRRVVCSSCVITQDYNARRLTIVYDLQSGLVRAVKCG